MAMSLNDIMSVLRTKTDPHVVGITLTVHSQARSQTRIHNLHQGHGHNAYYGYGVLLYIKQRPPFAKRGSEYLGGGFNTAVKVLNNMSFSSDLSLRGSWGENQTFLVKEPASEFWQISIVPGTSLRLLFGSFLITPPQITITIPNRPNIATWHVALTDDDAFLRGIGPDPFAANEKALYCVAFGDIEIHNTIS
jgi:hypothetical protein